MTPAASQPRSVAVALLAIGFASIAGQLVLLRELSVAFFGVELIYLLGLGAWLLFGGVGALLAPRRRAAAPARAARLLALLTFALLAELVALRSVRVLLGIAPGAFLPLGTGALVLVAALLPPALISGWIFALLARTAVDSGRSFGTAYAIESAGGLVGGAAVTLALAQGVNATALTLAVGIVALLAAGLSSNGATSRGALAVLVVVGAAVLTQSPRLDLTLTRISHPTAVESRDSPYARHTVTRRQGQVAFFVNDALDFESQGIEAETFVDPVLLAHPAPQSVAVLGAGTGDLVREALRHNPVRVDAVELDRVTLDLARRYLPHESVAALADARVRFVVADPRRFLAHGPTYDVILIGVGDPSSGQANRFYTREFFLDCARHLTAQGVLGLRLRGAENLWTPQLTRRMAAVDRALRVAFRDVLFLPGSVSTVLASRSPLPRDGHVFGDRFLARGLSARLVSPAYLSYLVGNDRVEATADLLARTSVEANSDARPICYAQAAALWLAKFYPSLGFGQCSVWGEAKWAESAVVAGAVLLLIGLVLMRRQTSARRAGLAFVAGLNGMIVEGVLILHYQAQRGALFQDLGVLLTVFMAGLALGAQTPDRAQRRFRLRPLGVAIVVAMASVDLLVAEAVRTAALAGIAGACVSLFTAGVIVGAALAWAGLASVDPGRATGPLYAADLGGGAVGAVLASLVLVPVLGLVTSTRLVALCALIALASV